MVLICQNCRLVNGQAPPGTKSLGDVGKWRCFSCGALNGVENEAEKVVQEIVDARVGEDKGKEIEEREKEVEGTSGDDSMVEVSKDDSEDVDVDADGDVDADEGSAEGDPVEVEVETKPKKVQPKGRKKKFS